jgi:hypothetical protein
MNGRPLIDPLEPGMTPRLWAELTGEEMSYADLRQEKRTDFIYDTIVAIAEGRIDQERFQSRMDILDAIDQGKTAA